MKKKYSSGWEEQFKLKDVHINRKRTTAAEEELISQH